VGVVEDDGNWGVFWRKREKEKGEEERKRKVS
jgi:hypothetical protein